MSALAPSTSIIGPVSHATPGFGALLLSEWTKLRSIRSTWIIVAMGIGLSIGFSAVVALISGLTYDAMSDGLREEFDPILTSMGGWIFGMVLVIVLGVTSVTSEYSSRMVRTTFILNPQRTRVFAAKAVVVGLVGMTISAIVIPGMFLVSQPIYGYYGLETASVTDHDAIRFLLIAGLLQGVFHTLIPFSFAWLLRGTASAITTSLGFSVLPWMLTTMVPQWVKENVFRYLPDNAKDSLIGQLEPGATLYLGDTAASIVVAAWIVGLLATALFVLNRRDV
jgi:ABC-2 type transport system permease protein